MLGENVLEEVETFTYLGSIVNNHGGTDVDVKARIGKAIVAFLQLKKNTWSARAIATETKFRIFNSNVKSVSLYGSETWMTTKKTTRKVQTFIYNCLRRIPKIHWPETICKAELWQRTKQGPVEIEIKRRRWDCIGHTLRKQASSITRRALTWNPQGKWKRGRPNNSWRPDLKTDIEEVGRSWGEI